MIGPENLYRHDTGPLAGGVRPLRVHLEQTQLGLDFVEAARECHAAKLQRLIDRNAPVNFIDPHDRATALHYIAAYRARPALRVILKSGKCDFLIRDGQGRLPSQLAREFGHDDAMARLLLIKEIRQAQAQGIDPGGLYKRLARKAAR
jgi:ankyrin repeat protein